MEIEYPEGFAGSEKVVEDKGWLSPVRVTLSDRIFELTFYDPIRLSQDVGDDVGRGRLFVERNLVVIPSITREKVTDALRRLEASGFFDRS